MQAVIKPVVVKDRQGSVRGAERSVDSRFADVAGDEAAATRVLVRAAAVLLGGPNASGGSRDTVGPSQALLYEIPCDCAL